MKVAELFESIENLDETSQLEADEWLLEGEGNVEKALRNKAEKTKIAYGILKQVFNRGAAAWRQHHRPGVGQVQWAMGRVNSFITGKGQARKADKDLWAKA
jgi:hypothetical protein